MQFLFYFAVIFGILVFVWQRRRFDFLTLAFISSLVYFLPGFFGRTRAHYDFLSTEAIVDGTYVVFCVVLFCLIAARFLSVDDYQKDSAAHLPSRIDTNDIAVAWCALGLAAVGFLGAFAKIGPVLFSSSKSELMSSMGHWHVLWEIAASFSLILGVLTKSRFVVIGAGVLLALDLLVGFRSATALTLLALITIWVYRKGPQSLLRENFGASIALGVLASFFFVFKQISLLVKYGLYDRVIERLSSPELYVYAVVNSEPFTTQSILNEVMRVDYHVGTEHWQSLWVLLLPGGNIWGGEITSFNSLFQESLFSASFVSGMANNIWAQMYASGGWMFVVIAILTYTLMMLVGSRMLKVRSPLLLTTSALFLTTWAFYVHRNDLAYQLVLSRRYLMVAACLSLVSFAVITVKRATLRNRQLAITASADSMPVIAS